MARNFEEEARGNPKGGGNGKGRHSGKLLSVNEQIANARYFTGWDQTKFVREAFVITGRDSTSPTFSHCLACLEAAKTANGKVPPGCRKAILATTLALLPKRAVLDPDFQKRIQLHIVQGIPRHEVEVSGVEFVREPFEVTRIDPRKEVSCAENCALLRGYYPHVYKGIVGEPPPGPSTNNWQEELGHDPERDPYSSIGQDCLVDRMDRSRR